MIVREIEGKIEKLQKKMSELEDRKAGLMRSQARALSQIKANDTTESEMAPTVSKSAVLSGAAESEMAPTVSKSAVLSGAAESEMAPKVSKSSVLNGSAAAPISSLGIYGNYPLGIRSQRPAEPPNLSTHPFRDNYYSQPELTFDLGSSIGRISPSPPPSWLSLSAAIRMRRARDRAEALFRGNGSSAVATTGQLRSAKSAIDLRAETREQRDFRKQKAKRAKKFPEMTAKLGKSVPKRFMQKRRKNRVPDVHTLDE